MQTKHDPEDVKEGPAEGVYIHGMYLDGCGWSKKESKLVEAPAKVLYIPLPCMHVTAVQRANKKYTSFSCMSVPCMSVRTRVSAV